MPQWYGICSKEGKKVYTVPEAGGLGAVECVVVKDKEVVDTGSLGKLGSLQVISETDSTARIRRRWGEKGVIGAGESASELGREPGGLEIMHLPPGHSLTPVSPCQGFGHAGSNHLIF